MESKRVFFVAQMMRSGVSFITQNETQNGHLGSMKPLSKGEPGSLGNMFLFFFFSEKVNALYLAVDDSTLI